LLVKCACASNQNSNSMRHQRTASDFLPFLQCTPYALYATSAMYVPHPPYRKVKLDPRWNRHPRIKILPPNLVLWSVSFMFFGIHFVEIDLRFAKMHCKYK
jgi:hypothetical protein